MTAYGTGGGISIKIFPGDGTAISVGWDISLEQAEDYVGHLTARWHRPADWVALAGYDTPFVTMTFGQPECDPGAHACVTLAHEDGTEVRALWQMEVDTAHDYMRILALMHGALPNWSYLDLAGRPVAEFQRADDGSEPLDIG
ncbi:hypothetical protein AB0D67_36770 [Streptosporangium sp. NPDC048047]|uniref:hypothetical protein n=1 Tax=Streptosporangium sp. NPDC048047 TaxID=3155748 RepID=UPI003413F5D3